MDGYSTIFYLSIRLLTIQNNFVYSSISVHIGNATIVNESQLEAFIVGIAAIECIVLHLTESLHVECGAYFS